MPRPLWWLVLHGVILRMRPRRTAHAYRKIWTPQGSPLMVESQALARGLAAELAGRFGDRVTVELAMSYGQPAIKPALARLRTRNVQRLVVLPLYPQFSSTTTGSVFELVTRELGTLALDAGTALREPVLAERALPRRDRGQHRRTVARAWPQAPGVFVPLDPEALLAAGDPYHCFCHGTARARGRTLQLATAEWSIGFQSRFGREEWLKPYVDVMLQEYSRSMARSR